MQMDDRKFLILQAIIDDYITTAMPVGSRTISRKSGVGFSPATIRNEMSDLEELGYLDQPHTSAGRVPSNKAYRLYVDRLLKVGKLSSDERERMHDYMQARSAQVAAAHSHSRLRITAPHTCRRSEMPRPSVRPLVSAALTDRAVCCIRSTRSIGHFLSRLSTALSSTLIIMIKRNSTRPMENSA